MNKLDSLIAKASTVTDYHHTDVDMSWMEFEKNVVADQPAKRSKATKIIVIAALLVLSAILFYCLYPFNKFETTEKLDSPQYVEMIDGTKINLSPNSTLTYPTTLDGFEERRVIINGDATFDIAHNKDLPFIVQYGDMTVKVLGTEFKVGSIDEGKTVENISGQVKVFETENISNAVILNPGDIVLYTGGDFTDITPVKELPGKNVSLYDIYANLFDRTKGKIYLAGQNDVSKTDTLRIDLNKSVDEILTDLEKLSTFKYNKMPNGETAILKFKIN